MSMCRQCRRWRLKCRRPPQSRPFRRTCWSGRKAEPRWSAGSLPPRREVKFSSLYSSHGDEVEMVQPFTVVVLADTDPGPPVVVELDTEPPPACTCTPVEPAELLLEMLPAPLLLLPDEAPAALMLPSACFSTRTVQLSPDAVLPVLTMVSAYEAALSAPVSARAAVIVHARVM